MPPLLRHASFTTNLFESKVARPHFINPDTGFGEDVITWLIGHIRHPAIILDQPIQEDFGWVVWARVNGAPYLLAVSINGETIGSEEAEWFVTVAYERGCFPFRRVPPARTDDLLILCDAIDAVLHGDPAIRDIQWWVADIGAGQPTAHPV